jgi:predicted transcriptional regulator
MKVDLAAKLPKDDMGYGFDNIADVLSTSTLAVEQYLDSAERAIDIALGPVVEYSNKVKSIRPLIGEKKVAVLRFSGLVNEEKIAKKTLELTQWMVSKNLRPLSDPELARYNPPWTLPFLRRNEILIEVE